MAVSKSRKNADITSEAQESTSALDQGKEECQILESGSTGRLGDQNQEIVIITIINTNIDTTHEEVTKNTTGMMDVINTMKTRNITNDTRGTVVARTETPDPSAIAPGKSQLRQIASPSAQYKGQYEVSVQMIRFHAYLEQQNNQDREHAHQFWDGFQWVKKTETNPNAVPGSQFGISGDPSRNLKVHVTGLPTDLGISARDVREFFNKEILKNHPPEYKYSDQEQAYWRLSREDRELPRELLIELGKIPPDSLQEKDMPVVEVQLMPQLNAATIELKEARMSSWAKEINGIKMLGQTLRVHGFADRIQFQNKTLAALAQQRGIQAVIGQENVMNTQTTAQATAFALAAVKGLQGNEVGINIEALGLTAATSVASKYIKVANLCERSPVLSKTEFNQIYEDIKEMFEMYPGLVSLTMIDEYDQKLGGKKELTEAQYGSVFIEYDNIESAEKALKSMQGRTYDARIVRAVYITESLWNGELKIRAKKI